MSRMPVALAVLALAACADPNGEGAVRLSGWASSPAEDEAMRATVQRFNQEQGEQGVAARYEAIQANYIEKIQLMLATRTAPDVFMLEAFWAPALIDYDVLLSLDDLIGADPDYALEDFEPALLDAFRRDGKLYGIPKDYSTIALYYNPAMLAQVGLDRPPRDWQELREWAVRLTRDDDGDGTPERYGLGIDNSAEFVLPFVWQHGGHLVDSQGLPDPGDEAALEAIDFLYTLRDEGLAAVPTDLGAAWNMDAFGRGRVAMTVSGVWALNFLDTTFPDTPYAVAPIPRDREREALAYVVGYVIPASTQDPESAYRLLRYLTDREGQTRWNALDIGLPPRRSIVAASALANDPRKGVFIDTAAYARTWQLGTNQRLLDELQTAMQSIFLIGTPSEQALARARQRLERKR